MRIGTIDLPSGAALAPMAGVTDANMRLLCFEQGCAWAVSEMLSAKGYVYNPNSPAHSQLLSRRKGEGICGLQLFGSDPAMLSEAVKRLNESSFDFFDFNMGCPAHKIVSNGEGSALMLKPLKAAGLIEAMVKAAQKPITVKLRAGWDAEHISAPELARIAEQSGASAVTLHPRTRDMFYSGKADWSLIAQVKSLLRIPVIGNGDIKNGLDALKMLRETGCDAVMVARAAQGNVWIFDEIRCALEGRAFTPPSPKERVKMALKHLDMQVETLGERLGVMEMRKFIAWYLQGLPGSGTLRARVNGFSTRAEVAGELQAYLNRLEKAPSD